MNHNTQINTRIKLENIVILFIVLASLALLILSFLPSLPVSAAVRVSLEMGKMVQRAFSIVLLAVSLQLMKRRRAAWYITIFILLLKFYPRLFRVPPSGPSCDYGRRFGSAYHICLFQGGFLLSFLKTLEKGGRRVSAPVPGRHCSQCGA